ncbi:hypothetical protein DA83_03805 [Pseudomonas sp. 250J]|uniref:Uncharacterized protein n=1 Tax=Pseudomonas peradeniyensis TaxID=2745488 RepID=A0ABT2V9X3_9PSED|nr:MULTISPECIES: hypothetical protein [Pseudomonas]KNX77085.1 hypothetical protein DA83_03805 [Pseudomonas sp. 250J]MCU7238500.1 hypothetical protein [Pseudomonas peradeniyensis]MCU7281081.1 hypothetical protein [Pseudomonas peradeniyensis]QZA52765.1 hypothetical protein K2O50_17285 [Pseudomonas sp. 2hn]
MRHLATALAGALALAGLGSAWADEYQGTLKDNGTNVPVLLNIDPGAGLGKNAGKVRFGAGWACDFALEFNGADGPERSYSLKGGGAGRCGPLTLGYLQSRQGSDGLQIQLFTQANKLAYSATLVPPAR